MISDTEDLPTSPTHDTDVRSSPAAQGLTVSVQVPFVPVSTDPLLAFASLVDSGAAARLWQGASQGVDALHGFAAVAGRGLRVATGLGVALMPLRHPFDAAHQLRSLALVTGRPVTAAFGPGTPELQAGLLGARYRSPLTVSREYVETVRGLLAGELVDVAGDHVVCRAQMPMGAPSADVRIGLGVLRPGMARLAGEVADVAVTWLTPPAYVRDVLVPALRAGAQAAGRPAPRVVCIVPAALTADGADPVELLLAAHHGHLVTASYRDMLARAGVAPQGADPVEAARAAVRAGVLLGGDAAQVVAAAQVYRDAGVDELVLNTTGVAAVQGRVAAWQGLRTMLDGFAASGGHVLAATSG